MTSDTPSIDRLAKLRGVVEAFTGQAFAVVDGGQFDDLPDACRREQLLVRSLFHDHPDAEVERAGRWLVSLAQSSDALERVFAMTRGKTTVVYWSCASGEAILHRHLRTLNIVRIPQWAADGGEVPPPDGSGQEPAAVMFRHWDPRVLGGDDAGPDSWAVRADPGTGGRDRLPGRGLRRRAAGGGRSGLSAGSGWRADDRLRADRSVDGATADGVAPAHRGLLARGGGQRSRHRLGHGVARARGDQRPGRAQPRSGG
ncbi:DUF4123 domain-containing protein [Methylobacterium sp. IF7SW-B2]|nr:DUF4123 domain-containing protein [Methylobacterium ajmalii]MBK3407641.1 DUF4123 domain-containing protein [Methylobacterium ajmalii]MBK3424088.1 DUF4123 domain-containing protein [Methylobacterium ajmalii]